MRLDQTGIVRSPNDLGLNQTQNCWGSEHFCVKKSEKGKWCHIGLSREELGRIISHFLIYSPVQTGI